MKKIMFNDNFGLTDAVLKGKKTMTRRMMPEGTPLGNWDETVKKSRYQIGDIVAIAQRYKDAIHPLDWVNKLIYQDEKSWNNKMFVRADMMPHQIRITDICIERLRDISDDDCLREGIYVQDDPKGYAYDATEDRNRKRWWFQTPREAFAALIDKVSGKGTWDLNPWVWVYTFELVK